MELGGRISRIHEHYPVLRDWLTPARRLSKVVSDLCDKPGKMFEAIMRRMGLTESELAQRLLELEIRKRTAEADRPEQEVELNRKGKGKTTSRRW